MPLVPASGRAPGLRTDCSRRGHAAKLARTCRRHLNDSPAPPRRHLSGSARLRDAGPPWHIALRFNAPATGRAWERIADSLVISGPRESDPIAALETVLGKLPIARRLRDIGVRDGDLDAIAQAAMQDWFIGRNARPVRGVDDLLSILQAAW